MRKRSDGKIPCDQYIQNEDEYRIKQIIESVGCIPTFWGKFAGSMGLDLTNPKCKTAMDYGKVQTQIQHILSNASSLDITHKLHCTTMMATVSIRDKKGGPHDGRDSWNLEFWYPGISYREIINTKAYTSESLLGQVGGFVGMIYRFGFFLFSNYIHSQEFSLT